MRFDEGWDDDDGGQDTGSLPKLADGTHTGEIVDAKSKRLKFMESDKNPRGDSLIVTVDVRGYQPLECIIPATFRGKVEAVARAAGVTLPTRGEEWDERQLIGRTVTIETVLAVSKKGTEYVRVEKWRESPSKPLPPASPAVRRQAPAPLPANDDIPF